MIYILLIAAAVTLMAFAFGLLGNLPATPSWLTDSSDLLLNIIVWPIQLITSVVDGRLFFGSIVIISVVMAWEPIYHSIMWVLRKIPVLGVK